MALCDEIREELFDFHFDRYRYVVQGQICYKLKKIVFQNTGFCVQKDGQGFQLLTKAFANHDIDRGFKVSIQKGLVITIISVHAISIE